jgi:TonB family protein
MNVRLVAALAALMVCAAVPSARAQGIAPVAPLSGVGDIERVRALYGAAAYEEALAAIPAVGEPAQPDFEQYRALCLLALGREQEAMASVERIVRDNPLFVPSVDTAPRMKAMFSSARSRIVPGLARAAYNQAKAAYELKNRELAYDGFTRSLVLIDSLTETERAGLADLRLLAGEFLKLSIAPPQPAESMNAGNGTGSESAAFVAPVAVREQLPAWIPPDAASRRTEYTGLFRVAIDADGRVTSATIVKGSHPAYDALVISAATRWLYKPATRGGQPVVSAKEIQVRLVPE